MFHRLVLVVVGGTTLAPCLEGCADRDRPGRQHPDTAQPGSDAVQIVAKWKEAARSWRGSRVEELIAKWGPPDDRTVIGERQVLWYRFRYLDLVAARAGRAGSISAFSGFWISADGLVEDVTFTVK